MTATSSTTPQPIAVRAVGWRFVSLYALAYMSTCLLFLAPLLVSLALKVNSLVGLDAAPNSLALVAGAGAAVAMFTNPFCGKLSDRTSSRFGMRRPWIVGGLVGGTLGVLVVATRADHPGRPRGMVRGTGGLQRAPCRLGGGAPDQVRVDQRGMVAGILGVCLPVASVAGTFLVTLFTGEPSPCSWCRAPSPRPSS